MRRVSFLLAAALTLAVSSAKAGAKAGESSHTFAMEIIARMGQVPERTRPFHETRELAALTRPLTSSGVLTFRRPDYLRKTTLSPRPEEMILDGDTASIRRGSGDAHVVTLSRTPALAVLVTTLRAPLEGDGAALERYYTLEASGDARAWTLVMTPATAQAARFVRKVTLTGRNNAIDALRVVRANGDIQTLTIDP